MKVASRLASYFFVGFLLLGCSGDEPTSPVSECPGDPLSITVTVTPGEVVFSWSPACRLTGWNIEPVGSGADQWLVLYEGSNSIPPPVTYGVVPDGAREIHAAENLIPGNEYELYLVRWTGPGPQDATLISSTTFTR